VPLPAGMPLLALPGRARPQMRVWLSQYGFVASRCNVAPGAVVGARLRGSPIRCGTWFLRWFATLLKPGGAGRANLIGEDRAMWGADRGCSGCLAVGRTHRNRNDACSSEYSADSNGERAAIVA
jgi:hypothetical protein